MDIFLKKFFISQTYIRVFSRVPCAFGAFDVRFISIIIIISRVRLYNNRVTESWTLHGVQTETPHTRAVYGVRYDYDIIELYSLKNNIYFYFFKDFGCSRTGELRPRHRQFRGIYFTHVIVIVITTYTAISDVPNGIPFYSENGSKRFGLNRDTHVVYHGDLVLHKPNPAVYAFFVSSTPTCAHKTHMITFTNYGETCIHRYTHTRYGVLKTDAYLLGKIKQRIVHSSKMHIIIGTINGTRANNVSAGYIVANEIDSLL